MKVPKKIIKLLDARSKKAIEIMSIENNIDEWLIKHGANMDDVQLESSTVSGCMIYQEPYIARQNVIDYIENKM